MKPDPKDADASCCLRCFVLGALVAIIVLLTPAFVRGCGV